MRRIALLPILGLAVTVGIAFYAPITHAVDEQKCLSCHGKPGLVKDTGGKKVQLYVEEKVLNSSAHRFIDCTTCHTSKPHEIDTPLTKLSLAEKCGNCHQYQYNLHKTSIHGQQLAIGNVDVATCVDCHSTDGSPHSVKRVLSHDAPAYRKNIAQTCAQCHGNLDLMRSYGILEKVYESYMRSFHGKAMQLGGSELSQLNKATCANCHGTHDIKKAEDPKSPVAGLTNLAKTCEQCHPGAGENYASGFLGHRDASPQSFPAVFIAERFFLLLTTLAVTFGVLIVTFELVSWFVRTKRKREEN